MKVAAIILLAGLLMVSGKSIDTRPEYSAKEVLQKVLDKLEQLTSLQFKQHIELNYPSERYHYEDDATGYLEFCSMGNSPIGVKFQFENDKIFTVFNGTEKFLCVKEEKTIDIDTAPRNRRYYGGFTFFQNSVVMLKNALPLVLANDDIPKSISDTTINDTDYFFVEFTLVKQIIDGMGAFMDIEMNAAIRYQLIVDRQSFLPLQIMKRDPSDNLIKIVYSEIRENPAPPAEVSWYYSNYMDRYSVKAPDTTRLIEAGKTAPPWKLPVFGTPDSLSSVQLKGKVVLLEFWIAHCGYCIQAVSKLNDLKKKYAKNSFELLALNVRDSDEIIDAFVSHKKPAYKILSGSKAVAKDYGVNAYPIVVLIDKKGVIRYAGGLEVEKIDQLVRSSL
jgi:thiol-disulfide isomerase/thioredoxin/outer membrane lipoprotein-sorting protein